MMGVTGKSTGAEEASLLGLMAFLGDKEKCAARLAELRAAANEAETGQNDARAERERATKEIEAANAATALSVEAEKRAKESCTRAIQESEALAAREAAVAVREAEVKETAVKQKHALESLLRDAEELAVRIQGVADAEAAALAVKTEYEGKLKALSAIVAPQA